MKALTRYVMCALVSIFVVGCSSAPKYTRTPTPTAYQYAAEPKRTDVSDDTSAARRHAREMQALQMEHEKRLTEIEYTAKENAVAKEKGVATPTAPATTQVAPASAPAQVRWWTPNDPYGTGQIVQNRTAVVQPVQVEYRAYTGLSNDEYWAARNGWYGSMSVGFSPAPVIYPYYPHRGPRSEPLGWGRPHIHLYRR